jgi:hypothetical protein
LRNPETLGYIGYPTTDSHNSHATTFRSCIDLQDSSIGFTFVAVTHSSSVISHTSPNPWVVLLTITQMMAQTGGHLFAFTDVASPSNCRDAPTLKLSG